jgi:hypothetical protein
MNHRLTILYATAWLLSSASIHLVASHKVSAPPEAPAPLTSSWISTLFGLLGDTAKQTGQITIAHANKMVEYLQRYKKISQENRELLNKISLSLFKWNHYYSDGGQIDNKPKLGDIDTYTYKLRRIIRLNPDRDLSENQKMAIDYLIIDLNRMRDLQPEATPSGPALSPEGF